MYLAPGSNYDDEWYEIGEGESLDFSAEWDM